MESKVEVRNKKAIYMNNHQLIKDVFDEVYTFNGFLVAYNSKHFVIIDPKGDLLVSEEGTVWQAFNNGEYTSIRKDGFMGVYHYDGTLVIPFEFHSVGICDNDEFWVSKYEDDEFSLYKQS